MATPLMPRARETLVLALLVAALFGPFLGKAYHVDDLYTLQAIRNILRSPLDPLGGTVGWVPLPRLLRHFELNPPLLPYLLAPAAALSDFSEIALHAALLPLLLLLAWACLWLGRRFAPWPWWAALFVMTSPGITVSGNVMRDVPALALGTAAVAVYVAGSDRGQTRLLLLGALLAGLAALTKYSAVVVTALLALYSLLQGRRRELRFAAVPLGLFGLWCLHSFWMYAEVHPLAISRGGLGPLRAWRDNLCGLAPIVGGLCLLLPGLFVRALERRDVAGLGAMAAAAVLAAGGTAAYLGAALDGEYLFWSVTGAMLLAGCLTEGVRGALAKVRDGGTADSAFLLVWACAPLLFSLFFVPFQAVRHVIPALPPLVLLAVRASSRGGATGPGVAVRGIVAAVAGLQLLLGVALAVADYDHAGAQRQLAASFAGKEDRPWFHGSWGFIHYARRAGLRQLSPQPPFPEPGDVVLQPQNTSRSADVREHPALAGRRLEPLPPVTVPGRAPFRTIHEDGANFYAVIARGGEGQRPILPFRWLPDEPVEVLEVFEVR
jgi:hypothetical protein